MNPQRNPIGWFEIYVQDMDRARAFYEQTFQVALERIPTKDIELWAFPCNPDHPGCAGALAKMAGKDSGTGGIIIYFSCLDCDVEASRAVACGGRLQKPKTNIGDYGFIALVIDPDGNMIGLHSRR